MLADLDVPISVPSSNEGKDNSSKHSEVLYLDDFLKMNELERQELYFHKEEQVYNQDEASYPKLVHNWNNNINEQGASLKFKCNLREKLCGRIQRIEKET